MRMCMPDSACRGITVEGAQTGRSATYNGQIVDVTNPRHQRALLAEGAFPASLSGVAHHTDGYRCGSCGHGSFFRRCGRCGSDCEKEES